jgi:ceramide glucosyltransferase
VLGIVSVKQGVGQDLVVGKSMALRKSDVRALGGFEAYVNMLAEDFLIGQHVRRKLGKRVVLAKQPVFHVTANADVRGFWRRFTRWSIMQRKQVGLFVYGLQIFQNPIAMALAAFLVRPSMFTLGTLLAASLLRSVLDGLFCWWIEGDRYVPGTAVLSPLKDFIMAFAWGYGLLVDRINWRGHPLRVVAGAALEPLAPCALPESETDVAPAGGGR